METQRRLLDLIVAGAPRQRVLDTLCVEVERIIPGTRCWVMERGVDRLRLAAAPSVPRDLIPRLDGLPRDAGTCGAAIGEGRIVMTPDTSLDPLWATLPETATEVGIRSCWSVPIRATGPAVLGTFAITSSTPGRTLEEHLTLLEIAGHVAGIAMVRDAEACSACSLESTYRAIFDAASDAIFVHDAETGAIIDVNRKTCELFGYRYDEALGLDIGDVSFGGADDLDRALGLVAEAAAGRPQLFEWRCRHREGPPFWCEVSLRSAMIGDEKRVLAIVRDITERRRAVDALRESEARFRQITESINEVFWLSDWKQRRVIYVSPTYESIWGLSCESLHRDPDSWKRALHPNDRDRVTSMFYRDAPLGKYDIEFRVVWPDGSVHWVHEKAFPIRNEQGEVHRVAGICEDITGRKEFEKALRRKGETEALLRRELNHRVRNNLSSLVSLIDLTQHDATDVERFAATIRGRVHAMATAHEFLSRSRWATVDLEVLLRALVPKEAADRVRGSGPELTVGPDQANSLSMVLHELVTNSLKHGVLGGDEGRVGVSWTAVDLSPSRRRVTLGWRESGGPAIEHEPTASIGSSLIEGLIKADLQGTARLRYPTSGADHELEFVLEVLNGSDGAPEG